MKIENYCFCTTLSSTLPVLIFYTLIHFRLMLGTFQAVQHEISGSSPLGDDGNSSWRDFHVWLSISLSLPVTLLTAPEVFSLKGVMLLNFKTEYMSF